MSQDTDDAAGDVAIRAPDAAAAAVVEARAAFDVDDQPYPGLRSFRRDEAHIFFGREGTINAMVDRLAEHRFLAVTGASGSGKSSLVRTGLLDALDRGLLAAAGSDWVVVDFRPGNQPLAAMAAALLEALEGQATPDQCAVVGARLARGPTALAELLADLGVDPRVNVLLLVDQFEETFRYRQNDEADAFVAVLLASVAQRERRIYGVITMRSDFLGDCSRFSGLAEAINDSQFLAPRLTRAQLREAIEEPAAVYDGHVEPALVTQLLNDVGSNPDQLPLVQHVLMLMWQEAWEAGPDGEIALTVKRYRELGGIVGVAIDRDADGVLDPSVRHGALSAHLDRLLGALSPERQRLAEVLFRTLVDSEGAIGRDVRRPTPLGEIAAIAGVPVAELIPVIEEFRAPGRNFLLPPRPAPLNAATVIDISHESLIRQWYALRGWVHTEFASATEYRRIETTATLWSLGHEGLLRMPYLGVATQWRLRQRPNAAWAARYGGDFNRAIRFLDRSIRAIRQRRVGALLALLLLFGGMGYFGFTQYHRAETNASERDAARRELQQQQETLEQRLSRSLNRMSLRSDDIGDEATDYGVATQDTLRTNIGSQTPTTIPGGHILLLRDFQKLYAEGPRPLLIDVWNAIDKSHNATIPTAVRIPFAGDSGTFDDETENRVMLRLENLTNGDRKRPLVFFCQGSSCWESYNAALRAIHAGFTNVFWFRGGNHAWTRGGNDWQSIDDEVRLIELRLAQHTLSPRQRWADGVALGEASLIVASNVPANTVEPPRVARRGADELAALFEQLKGIPAYLSDLADCYARLAVVLQDGDDYDATIAAHRDELKIRKSVAEADHASLLARRRYIDSLYWLAAYQTGKKHDADAAATTQLAQAASQPPDDAGLIAGYGRANPALWYRDVGDSLRQGNLIAEAKQVYAKAQETDAARLGSAADKDEAGADLWDDYALLGKLREDDKQLGDAIDIYQAAADILTEKALDQPGWPKTKLSVAAAYQAIAAIFVRADYLTAARVNYMSALDAAEKAVAAGNVSAPAVVREIANSLGGLAWRFDKAGSYDYASDTAQRAIAAAPADTWINLNLAHALMLLGQSDDARKIYLRYIGTTSDDHVWNDEVRNDFSELRRVGHDLPLMKEIETRLPPPPPN